MKQITTMLLTVLALACSAQEPDTHTYSDSLHNAVIDSIINYKDSVISQLNIALINRWYADTATITLEGVADQTVTIITKTGENITTTIENGDKRITSIFSEGNRETWFFNDLESVGGFKLDSVNKVLISYDPNVE